MSDHSIFSIYESVMQSIREAQQETYKVIQNFVNDTNQAIQRVSEQHERTEKTIDRVSVQHEETKKSLQELSAQHKETQKSLQEYVEEGKKERKKLSKQMGTLGNRFGEITEHMVFPAVVKRFNELGYNFNFEFEGNCKVRDKNNQVIAEIDIYLENGTTIAVVEVKTKPDLNDINKHIQRIEKLKQNCQEKNEPPKKLIGAIAGAIFPKEVKETALQAGFYVLVQSGDTMKLEIPQNFKPREF
ncbi:MAG: hypothetical protein LBE12_07645 [Planctomycetaceae bacterium]|jgi:hypothetical protein|nr:hypothetical protein [Planctomycetaceae bacterium]